MKIAISGASGFIGTNLKNFFEQKGYKIIALGRSLFEDTSITKLQEELIGVNVVINLAGAPINHRWTNSYKKEMYDSRIKITKMIVKAINSLEIKPSLFISTSAVGYYPSMGTYDEISSVKGSGFLSDLCQRWEQEASRVASDVRLAITRFGVIIADQGGAFSQMTLSMKFKVATIIGPGSQSLSWIYIGDLLRAMEHIINQSTLSGVVNFVAPEQTTNKVFTKTVSKFKNCFISVTIPKLFFDTLLGEASSFITEGQNVIPRKLLESKFTFCAPTTDALLDQLYVPK